MMKKTYSKPDIMFEDFSLSTSITAGCEKIVSNLSDGTCGYKYAPNIYLFNTTIGGCNRTELHFTEGDDYDGLCYHNPNESYNLFSST